MTVPRQPQIVPQDPEIRLRIRDAARLYVEREKLVPPQTLERLRIHARRCWEASESLENGFGDFVLVMLNNALWEQWFTTIPADKRLLLLPFCLRNQATCKAERDDWGLLCEECHCCDIPKLTKRAEQLGMPVLVAESSSRVVEWVENDDIQGVVGVSCMNSLEKAFPAMLRFAVPGIAVPLLRDGCKDTDFDRDLLDEALATAVDVNSRNVSHGRVRERLDSLFTPAGVGRYLQASTRYLHGFSHEVLRALCGNGKHYRPMITFLSYAALTDGGDWPEFLDPIALAVECFHKASLIHDDIEDADTLRYGKSTLHESIGIPAALNVGDFLIGEGYRLLNHVSVPLDIRADLTAQAAQAHCELSLGQAQELESLQTNIPLEQCLETHRLKTAPAFRVALAMGAISARKLDRFRDVFYEFADSLGVAYQLLDDLEDTHENPASVVDCLMRNKNIERDVARAEIADLYENYRERTYDILEKIEAPRLKITLFRLAGKVLKDA